MTLTELSYYTRRSLPFAALFGIVLIFIYIAFKLLLSGLGGKPQQATIYNPAFGKIAPPEFSAATSSAGFNFTLDTIEGVPVTATGSAAVYFIPESPTRFGYREKLYLMAKSFGFEPEINDYRLVDGDRVAIFESEGKKLLIDIGNFNFSYSSEILTDSFMAGSISLTETEIKNKAINFLSNVDRYPAELARGTTNLIYLNYDLETGNFVNVERAVDAVAVEVDFYRPKLNDIPMTTPKFFNSQNYLIMTFGKEGMEVLRGQVKFFEKSEEQSGIYPLKTGQQAWEKFTKGNGVIVAGMDNNKYVTIKKMFPAYYDPDSYQTYLQPVYVFIGENDFVGYVDALDESYLVQP